MRTIKLTVEYDGTGYVGWQIQPNGPSIQAVLEGALAEMLKEPVRVFSSGRTDAGVHARGMVASFVTTRTIPLRAFTAGLNCLLPPDISIKDATEAAPGFNPRQDAAGKWYRYTIRNTDHRSPLARYYAWHLRDRLDIPLMQQGAEFFKGEHDFAAFRTEGCAAKTTIRRIESVTVARRDDLVIIDVAGSGFLRNMVRIMVGTLVEIGRGKREPETVAGLLADPAAKNAGPTAPPHGLCLMEVYY